MTFQDIFKRSFLEGWANTTISSEEVAVSLVITAVLALYIFLVYRLFTKETFYSRSFNISLVGVAVITAAIIVTIHSSIVVSLGMVGALSIVRFRTAVKDPVDLMFLFWSIGVGLICGAGHAEYAVILSVVLTICIFLLERMPVAKASMILVVNTSDLDIEVAVIALVRRYAKGVKVKARNYNKEGVNMTMELRVNGGAEMMRELLSMKGVEMASLLEHNGEAVF